MNTRIVASALALAALAGCDSAPSAVESPLTFSAIGAYNVSYWYDPSVPGSLTPRPGISLPKYLVCPVEGDVNARAAAVINDAQLRLHPNGSAELILDVGTWMRREGIVTANGGLISRWGNWTEETTGEVTLTGFNVPGFGQTLRYTELGAAEIPITVACPGGSSVASLNPMLTLSRVQ